MARALTRVLQAVDHALGRLGTRPQVLIELRTPVSIAVLGPVIEALRGAAGAEAWFTSEYPDRMRPLVPADRFLTHRQAEWRRFDVYVNADPWGAARLRRCAARVNFFHGVAGKYDLDDPRHLPMGFEYYDRVAFINPDRMRRYLAAGVVTERQARLVGYPKLDGLASGALDGAAVRRAAGLESGRATILYAPTYSAASSLALAGEAIVRTLADAGFNVLVKLHDRSLDPDARYTGGIDWRTRMRGLERPGRVTFAEQADSSPLLAAADLLVTDHSSVGFEYLVLDRPLVVYDAPALAQVARINPERIAQLRGAAAVAADPTRLVDVVRDELAHPARRSEARRRLSAEMFHDPGRATARAVALIREVLEGAVAPVPAEAAAASGPRGVLS